MRAEDQLAQTLSDHDRRMHTLEQYVWGPNPGKLGNQPIHYIGGNVQTGTTLGGFPIYFDSQIFEVRGMVLTPPLSDDCIVVLRVLDEATQETSNIGLLEISLGEVTGKVLLSRKVKNGDWCYPTVFNGGGARDLTISWRVM